jgi:peptidylprolyl isomerase
MKVVSKVFIVIVLAAGLRNAAAAQPIDEIAALQNSRSLADGKLDQFLHSPVASERARAAIALGNLQDTTSLPSLLPLLNDSSFSVRRDVAFAIGQIAHPAGAAPLFSRLHHEVIPVCVKEIIDAIGKCGSKEDERSLTWIARDLPAEYHSAVALSIARFAYRRVRDSLSSEYVAGLLRESLSTEMATYAVMRIGDSSLVKRHISSILQNLHHRSPEVRMWTATIVGTVNDSVGLEALVKCAAHDKDWRVRVNAVRAMRAFSGETARPVLFSLIADSNEHVSLAAFSALNASGEKYLTDDRYRFLINFLFDSLHYSWRQRGEASNLMAKVSKERSIPQLVRFLDGTPHFRSKIISALGETQSSSAIPYLQKELLQKNSGPVSAAIEAYGKIIADKDEALQSEFCRHILPLLDRRDVTISNSVAVALEDTSIRKSVRMECVPQLVEAFKNLTSPDELEVKVEFTNLFGELKSADAVSILQSALHGDNRIAAQAAAKALLKITGKNYDGEISVAGKSTSFYTPGDFQLVTRYRSAKVTTTKGDITIEFRADAAPFTVLNFILLAQKHFYDGLTFHRVVPNFVIQGGDPLATGFGGPGYTICTEVHPEAQFSGGAVGLASAGKDTEGSQFFVTHCPTLHLDGRYTVFGYTRDFDAVDRIQVGDTILKVSLGE